MHESKRKSFFEIKEFHYRQMENWLCPAPKCHTAYERPSALLHHSLGRPSGSVVLATWMSTTKIIVLELGSPSMRIPEVSWEWPVDRRSGPCTRTACRWCQPCRPATAADHRLLARSRSAAGWWLWTGTVPFLPAPLLDTLACLHVKRREKLAREHNKGNSWRVSWKWIWKLNNKLNKSECCKRQSSS